MYVMLYKDQAMFKLHLLPPTLHSNQFLQRIFTSQ